MPIRLEQKGLASLYGRAAVLAGKSQASIRKEQAAIRAREIRQEQKLREEAQIRAIEAGEKEQRRALQARRTQQEQALEAQRIREESAQIQLFQRIRAQKEAQKDAERVRRENLDIEKQYRTNMKMLDAQLDLETFERAKRWEIEKAEIASRSDFTRQEQIRQQKLDEQQAKLTALEKAFEAGIIDEEEHRKYAFRLTTGIPLSVTGKDEFGVRPYWMRGREAPEGTPERQLYEAKMAEGISGVRAGTLPWDLDPRYIRSKAANESRRNRGIFLKPEDIDAFISATTEVPIAPEVPVPPVIPVAPIGEVPVGEVPFDIGVEDDIEAILTGLGEPSLAEVITEAAPPIYAVNRTTGERIVSYDNGKTWKPVEEEIRETIPGVREPIETIPFTREFGGKF